LKFGTLYFIPVTLSGDVVLESIPADVLSIAKRLTNFVVENEKTSRHYLSAIGHPTPIRDLSLHTLNEHTQEQALPNLLKPLLEGHDIGLMSEAGCPGIADPGAKLAALAHQKGIRVAPLIGPSSILLGLMASGLNGQRFTFLGYIPSDKSSRVLTLKEIEKRSKQLNETQIFIETPYRNPHMLEDILANCHGDTRLCVACNITSQDELILTKKVREWKQTALPDIHKKPTVFLLLA
jgi:16S rRNA (cytidine1402-2'-O)-methyltransferase